MTPGALLALVACEPGGVGATFPPLGSATISPAPPAVGLRVFPADPVRGRDDLVCDAGGAEVSWTRDGVPLPSPDGRIDADQTRAGGVFRCEAGGLGSATVEPRPAGTNLLVILADDLGREQLAFAGGTHGPPTPALDALAADGVTFTRAWSTPVCSATRATLVTGRYPSRTGIGDLVHLHASPSLSRDEVSLARAVSVADPPWSSGWIGKWHLNAATEPAHPLEMGFDTFVGTSSNLDTLSEVVVPRPTDLGYAHWERNDEGSLALVEGWVTDATVEDALAAAHGLPEPWLLVVAFHGVHSPWDLPEGSPPPEDLDARLDAMIVDLDRAVGDLVTGLGELGERTTTAFASDNGSTFLTAEEPYRFRGAKGTTDEGGVRVPLVVAGPLVTRPGSTCRGLVHLADLYDTALALAGLDAATADLRLGVAPRPRDAVSLLPYLGDPDRPSRRDTVFTERFTPNGPEAPSIRWSTVRDDRFKLVRKWWEDREEILELYDLGDAVVEGPDLLAGAPRAEALEARDRLLAELERLDLEFAADPVPP